MKKLESLNEGAGFKIPLHLGAKSGKFTSAYETTHSDENRFAPGIPYQERKEHNMR